MRRTIAAALVAALLPLPVHGQPGPLAQVAVTVAEPSSKIVIGDGVLSRGSGPAYTGATEAPFANAIAAIAAGGGVSGTIEVLPGEYVFAQTVLVSEPGVRVTGGRNSVITPRVSLAGPCFEVVADGFTLDGVTLEDHRDAPPAPVSFLDVSASSFTLAGCKVAVSSADPAAPTSNAIRIQGAAGPANRGALVHGNELLAGRSDDAAGTVDAHGRVLLSAAQGHGLRVVGNTFRSGVAPGLGGMVLLRNAISLQDEEYTTITGNTFHGVTAPDEGNPEDLGLVVSRSVSKESNHLVFSANYIETCGGRSILALQGHGFSVVSGNGFGRLVPGPFGALCLKGGTGNVVSGNNFHNYAGSAAAPAIRVIGERGIGIQSNSFSIPKARQVWLEGVKDAVVNGNQFLGEVEGGDGHLHLDEVTGGSIVGNRFAGGVCPSIRLSHSLRDTPVLICANVFDEVAGCASPWDGNYAVETCTSAANGGNPEF